MKKLSILFLLAFVFFTVKGKDYVVSSPNNKLSVKLQVDDNIRYSVLLNGNEIVSPSLISMQLESGEIWGKDSRIKKASTVFVSEEIIPVVARKYAKIYDEYNQLTLTFKDYSLQFRAYNEGAAWRWISEKKGNYKIAGEVATFAFPEDYEIWFPEEESMFSHQERLYLRETLSKITPNRFCSTGMLVDCRNNIKTYISESNLMDYAGMFLQGSPENKNALVGKFPGVVLEEQQQGDRNVKPVNYASYIAECDGPRVFPWRVLIVSENDEALVQSELIFKLGPELKLDDTSWIKPGKVAWDWWNACNIYGVDFESGVNNNTYKYYIDFAAKYGLEYIILDEGWYHLDDIMNVVDEIDVKELVEYGNEKNVGVILWVVWKALDDKLTEALNQFEEWGVKGIKIDFMQRDDQWMVNFYEKIADECAKRKMLVDYHGAYKPSGLNRAYPNAITF